MQNTLITFIFISFALSTNTYAKGAPYLLLHQSGFSDKRILLLTLISLTVLAAICSLVFYFLRKQQKGHNSRTPLGKIIRCNTMVLLGSTIVGISSILIGQGYVEYKLGKQQARCNLIELKKNLVQREVERVVNEIDYLRRYTVLNDERNEALLKKAILEQVRNISYDNGVGYMFVLGGNGTMLAHAPNPELEGTDVTQYVDKDNIVLFDEISAAASQTNGGFASYTWEHPETGDQEPKISFAKRVPDWDWIIVAGNYLKDIEGVFVQEAANLKARMLMQTSSILAVGVVILAVLLVTASKVSAHILHEVNLLETGISENNTETLAQAFSISEFQSIADGIRDAFFRAEDARQTFTKAFQHNGAPMLITSLKDGCITEVNTAFLETLQFTKDEVLGKSTTELGLVSEEERSQIIKSISETGTSEGRAVHFKDKLGEEHYGEITTRLIELNTGNQLLTTIYDTTDRYRSEEQILQLYRAIEQSPVSVVITDLEGNIEYVNPKFCDVSGYTRNEVLGQNPRVLKSGETTDDRYSDLWHTICRGETWRGEFHNKHKNGTLYWEAATISGLRDSLGNISHFLAVKEDITEKKALESELVQAHKLESVGQLAAGIAHEINTPIQFVSDNLRFIQDSIADLLKMSDQYVDFIAHVRKREVDDALIEKQYQALKDADLDYLSEELPAAVDQSLEGTARVSNIVKAMKEFSHPGSGEMTEANLNEAIETTITVAKNEWKYCADIQRELDPDLPLVPCFIGEFNQVILNMIVNARDAIEETGEKGRITLATSYDQTHATVRISDTGAGMTEEVQSRIFDPFYTTKEVGKGSGQGMAIAYNVIVNKHHGEINIQSTPGKGTTFEIRLPLQQQSALTPELIDA